MRLIRAGEPGREVPGVLVGDDSWQDLSPLTRDIDGPFLGRVARGEVLAADLETLPVQPLGTVRLGAPIARPPKIICIGLNYADHAEEAGMPIPPEPILFLKAPSTLVGPYDDVRIPRGSRKTDWEVELGVVIGEECRYLESPDQALERVAGYCVTNDVSEREFQLERGSQWDKGKSCETFNPAGPWLVTRDEVPDPQRLRLWLDVNGQARQRGITETMVFGVAHLVWYLSQFLVLEPGDLINTGTPPGVGLGLKPKPVFLRAGDVMELGIEKLGAQRQRLISAP